MLTAQRLSKEYSGQVALQDLDLDVQPGEIYCLLGANGAGKTTTIYLFLDFIKPTAGAAVVNGVHVARDPLEAKRHVGYLSENVRLYGTFTARQNLEIFARFGGRRGLGKEEYYDAMRRVGLPEESFERRVQQFSKGMRQKLGLAICMIKQAPALLLDEPLAGLDPKAAAELTDILLQLRERGRAILMSTHDIFRAKKLADRVGILKNGVKVVEKRREELAEENLERLYLNYMNAS